ncbi:SET and MYND domain-containing protein 4 isoform X2 [Ceratitis capitata]|uniref:(Mediterranean fruit fly) hypothetical protein n=1 Tax=Ceratitis capitata TaxID=7213 RepID=W8B3Z8_CERCA|nr:SET and MYND domain-containing protein 4 isoform X2 [Ceratitis capitata]CAD7013462.1 unnamed protein product [Ceratitis capitata]
MEKFKLSELLEYQTAYTQILDYECELETILAIKKDENWPLRRQMSAAWLKGLSDEYKINLNSKESATKKSNRLREEGNVFYCSKSPSKTENMFKAGQQYTLAIFAAAPYTEALALAFANRAMVLQELGYYRQAYDDCICALETNQYPMRLIHKIKIRQAFCVYYLQDAKKLELHLTELEKCGLNESYKQRVDELQKGLSSIANEIIKETQDNDKEDMSLTETTELVDSKDATRGRYVVAKRDIKSGEIIFHERISAFVPVEGTQICQQCGSVFIIPIPCHACNGKVIYCSLKCREDQAKVHQNECVGYCLGLFEQIGISHLALRILLEEFPQISPILAHESDIKNVWKELTTETSHLNTKTEVNYVKSLRLVSHFQKMSLSNKIWFAVIADLLAVYLKEYTPFFHNTSKSKIKQSDWESLISALILRHIGQSISNAHTCSSIAPTCYDIRSSTVKYGFLLLPNMWTKPFHLRQGMLHVLGEVGEVSAANIPYLSMLNHACNPTIRPRFSGRNFSALADRDIEEGDEIYNCYTLTYRNSMSVVRRDLLKEMYHFNCECVHCQQSDPDAAYLEYHLYKCQNPKCGEKFVPTPDKEDLHITLHWWNRSEDDETGLRDGIICSICSTKQNIEWYFRFKSLLQHSNSKENRLELLKLYDKADGILLGFHSLKLQMASDLVNLLIECYKGSVETTDLEFCRFVNILKFAMSVTADKWGQQSLEYVAIMSVLWDLIAMNKYQCTQLELNDMVKALDVVDEECRLLFMNYYKDYIYNKQINMEK